MILIISVVLIIILCVLIVVSILLQEDKAHGGIGFIGGTSQSFFGVSSGSILSRITSVMLTILLISTVVIAIFIAQKTSDLSINSEAIKEAELTNYIDKKVDFKVIDATDDTKNETKSEENTIK
ncbi:MAG: preprotein translocase subunit SecG [Spirochaetes bacterium]|nr:preprotein translocase subunit SecG [Spirochaetota bacterium]